MRNTSVIQKGFAELERLMLATAAGEAQAPVPAPAPEAAPAPVADPALAPAPAPVADPAVAPAPMDPLAAPAAPVAEPAAPVADPADPAATAPTDAQFGEIDPDLDLSDLEGLEPADPAAPEAAPAPAPVADPAAPAPVDPLAAPAAPAADPALAPAPAPAAPAVACASVEDVMSHLDALASAGSDDPVEQLVATGAVHRIHIPADDVDMAAFAAAIDALESEEEEGADGDIEPTSDDAGNIHVTQIDADLENEDDYRELDRILSALFDGGDGAEVFDEGSDDGVTPETPVETEEDDLGTEEADAETAPLSDVPESEIPAAPEVPAELEQVEENTPNGAGDAAAEEDDDMVVRPVADEEALASATADQIQLVLSASPEPTWNVIVAGVAAASIELKNQADPARSASVFASSKYHDGLMRAMASQGVLPVLQSVNASFYANEFKKSALAQEIRASVEAESLEATASTLVDMRDRFLDRCNLVATGSAKGFFSKLKNPMTARVAEALASVGVPASDARRMAGSIVATASADMFRVIANEATNLMDSSDEVVEALRENIDDAGEIDRAGHVAATPEEETCDNAATASAGGFAARLARHSGTTAAARVATASAPVTDMSKLFGKLNMR